MKQLKNNRMIKIDNDIKVWITSDTHYNHTNICRGVTKWRMPDGSVPESQTRNFESLDKMNSAIVNNINEVVGQDDVLIHLGDWSFGGFEQIEEFYNSLDIGLDTNIGERGSRLSGGQKQRIGIARAIYGAPSLLVLDEPTSALDTESETALIESLQAIRGKMTIVVISHKVSTLKHCDRLLTMRDGRLIDFFAGKTEI